MTSNDKMIINRLQSPKIPVFKSLSEHMCSGKSGDRDRKAKTTEGHEEQVNSEWMNEKGARRGMMSSRRLDATLR